MRISSNALSSFPSTLHALVRRGTAADSWWYTPPAFYGPPIAIGITFLLVSGWFWWYDGAASRFSSWGTLLILEFPQGSTTRP